MTNATINSRRNAKTYAVKTETKKKGNKHNISNQYKTFDQFRSFKDVH